MAVLLFLQPEGLEKCLLLGVSDLKTEAHSLGVVGD
jgi:hypothetical protein